MIRVALMHVHLSLFIIGVYVFMWEINTQKNSQDTEKRFYYVVSYCGLSEPRRRSKMFNVLARRVAKIDPKRTCVRLVFTFTFTLPYSHEQGVSCCLIPSFPHPPLVDEMRNINKKISEGRCQSKTIQSSQNW